MYSFSGSKIQKCKKMRRSALIETPPPHVLIVMLSIFTILVYTYSFEIILPTMPDLEETIRRRVSASLYYLHSIKAIKLCELQAFWSSLFCARR